MPQKQVLTAKLWARLSTGCPCTATLQEQDMAELQEMEHDAVMAIILWGLGVPPSALELVTNLGLI